MVAGTASSMRTSLVVALIPLTANSSDRRNSIAASAIVHGGSAETREIRTVLALIRVCLVGATDNLLSRTARIARCSTRASRFCGNSRGGRRGRDRWSHWRSHWGSLLCAVNNCKIGRQGSSRVNFRANRNTVTSYWQTFSSKIRATVSKRRIGWTILCSGTCESPRSIHINVRSSDTIIGKNRFNSHCETLITNLIATI